MKILSLKKLHTIIFLSILLSFMFLSNAVYAEEIKIDPCETTVENPQTPSAVGATGSSPWWCLDVNQFGSYFGTILNFVFALAVIIALGFLIFGGIKWITSGGDKGGVEGARNTIIAAIIGLIIVFLSYLIVNVVLQFLTGSNISGITIPSLGGQQEASSSLGNTDDTSGEVIIGD